MAMTPKPKTESKVVASTGAGATTALCLWLIQRFAFGGEAVPDAVAGFVAFVVPAVVAFVAGWVTSHTDRPDLSAAAEKTKRAE